MKAPLIQVSHGTTLRNLIPTLVSSRSFSITLISLLIIDLGMAVFHVLLNFGYIPDRGWHLEVSNGYAERAQYLKLTSCIILSIISFFRKGNNLRLSIAAVFVLLLLEDSLELHESFHRFAQPIIPLSAGFGLTPAQWWELLYGVIVGASLVAATAWAVSISRDAHLRQLALAVLCLLILFGGFGLGVDAVHAVFQTRGGSIYLESALGMLEELGEMVCITGIVALLFYDLTSPPISSDPCPG